MYIIFNKDGSVSESQLTDYINQHSDGVNYIDVSIVGKSVDEYTADGNFKLPNNELVSLTGAFTNKIKTSTGVYEGYRITLTAVVTEYQGDVALSIQVFNSDKTTLFTYPVTLYVNETTGRGGDPITQDQYEALRAMMADYQLQYARSNMRSYDTLAEATEDLPNLSEGQMILAKETADSETSSVYQKVGDKLEGVSLDGLAVDKFLRNKNAIGTGSFEWKVENQTYGYKNYFKIENGNQVTIAQDGGVDPTFTIGSGRTGVTLDKKGVTNDGLTIYWSNQIINQTGKPYYLDTRLLGLRNGVASLDANGKIPTYQLPSYVSDVLEFRSFDRFPTTGEVNKIYIALDTNKTYRWGGTVYVEIGSSLALGETSETAYAGDKGKRNADNIAALQTEKLNRKSGLSVTPETLVYACEAGGAESSYADKFIQASLQNIGNAIPITAGNGAIYGRSSQTSEDPEIANVLSYELITKAYADKSYVQINKDNEFKSGTLSFGLNATLQTEAISGGTVGNVGSGTITLIPSGNEAEGVISFVSKGSAFSMGLTGMAINTTGDFFVGEDFSALNPAWKAVTGLLSPWQFGDLTKGYEAIGFVNEKDFEGRANAPSPSRLTFFSPLGKASWFDMAGNAQYDYQLPKKSGTIALTSDLSEAGTSVTIRRW